jgi:NTP pyrophosphatase (non-canonical NTP hydrolase)
MTDEIRSLEDIWPLQAELNRRAGFDTQAIGAALAAMEKLIPTQDARSAAQGVSSAPGAGTQATTTDPTAAARLAVGKALKNYVDALSSECHELLECLSWKHWYREAKEGRQYELRDVQNARVEAADMLFFWVSICQLLGLSPEDVYRLYEKKLGINHRRQDESRTQAQHGQHEDENRSVV